MTQRFVSVPTLMLLLLASALAVVLLVATVVIVQAQYACPPGNPNCGCVDDFQPGSVCTAEDVRVAALSVHETIDTCGHPGDTGRFIFEVNAVAGANERYDIGFFIGLDGGSAQLPSRDPEGASCYHGYLPPPLSSVATAPGEIRYSPFFDAENDGDICGDVEQGVMNSYLTEEIDVLCVDNDDDGVVDAVSTCVSWDNQRNQSPVCSDISQAYPNTKSKCNCEDVPIPTLVIRKIVVDKVTDPPGDPTPFEFSLTGPGTNVSFSLTDAQAPYISGLLARETYAVSEVAPDGWVQTNAVCTNGLTTFDPSAISLTENREVRCTFYNKKLDGGGKFLDSNWNAIQDAEEPMLAGWTIQATKVDEPNAGQLYQATTRSDTLEFGRWFFPVDMPAGTYDVAEVLPPDWIATYPPTNGGVYRIEYLGLGDYTLLSEQPPGFDGLDFGNLQADLGDLPEEMPGYPSYQTTLAHDGARHALNGCYLGVQVDAECDGCPCECCAGDDANDGNDDEDGVIFSGLSDWANGQGWVDVTAGGADGCLNAWLDFTDDAGGGVGLTYRDGDFDDAYAGVSEWIIQNQPLVAGPPASISFAVPVGFLGNETRSYYFRFRYTPRDADGGCAAAEVYGSGGAAPVGLALGGEVEDYRLDFAPLAITLAAFNAQPHPAGIWLSWETVSEIDNAGFNLYRADSAGGQPGPGALIVFVPSQAPGSTQGALYGYLDAAVTAGQTYWYWLEDISLSGATTLHGPVSAVAGAPTAVMLSEMRATRTVASALPLAATVLALALVAPLAGAAWVGRRRA